MTEAEGQVAGTTAAEMQDTCGIVMPIATVGDYPPGHWPHVRDLIERAITAAGYVPAPVWEGSDAEMIQAKIMHNLFSHKIVVVDVSGLNPNVMFELGVRLTIGKPTILVADDSTKLPFDTGVIEHEIYDRALRFHNAEQFMSKLTERIKRVMAAKAAGNYKAFIEHFGPIQVPEPFTETVPQEKFIADALGRIEASLKNIPHMPKPSGLQALTLNVSASDDELPSERIVRRLPSLDLEMLVLEAPRSAVPIISDRAKSLIGPSAVTIAVSNARTRKIRISTTNVAQAETLTRVLASDLTVLGYHYVDLTI